MAFSLHSTDDAWRLVLQTYLKDYAEEMYLTYDDLLSRLHIKYRGLTVATFYGPTVLQSYDSYLTELVRAALNWKVSMDMWCGKLKVCL